jgi:DNA-binding NarL/FixJ family response regulator
VIRVVLVDDQALVRTGFALILGQAEDITVVGQAGGGDEAVAVVERVAADVVLMDVRMPGTDGVAATRRIRALPDPPRVLILTTFDLDEYVYAGIQAGASGFLLKDTLAPDLLAAIRVVAAGEAVVAPTATRRLLEHFVQPGAPRPPEGRLDVLTAREREVLG